MNPRITRKILQSKKKLTEFDNKVNDMYTDGIANGFPPEILGYTRSLPPPKRNTDFSPERIKKSGGSSF